ncbi:hypothetical protein GN244_ATG03193 [Phytophthora infestans]|uniref:Uncharacterized protein n=1 Tax=Phytophthora infestans TaxID=4787 RepID=A0A833T9T2_PHYIN|nr:hypothetical protein GN244_ATG03193 [Phytophthora infestans]KAF4142866.1 hypothetical protein GN958_ATG07929 [Phytophthora infestans]KAI9988497.1 hypothetical protein PInf_021924 [Phytophthora infestans]
MATSVMHPIPKRTKDSAARPPMQRSRSNGSRPVKPMSHGLSHGFQMDLKQAVQLEKQELQKRGLLPPRFVTDPLPKMTTSEDEDDENSSYWLFSQRRLARRAASFTTGACPLMPCSPPMPIPQHEAQRRHSAADMKHESLSASQCEARLWDEFWNYKLSFESRESLNISAQASDHLDGRTAQLKNRSESSADTEIEDEDMNGPEQEEHVHRYGDVFEMDDL